MVAPDRVENETRDERIERLMKHGGWIGVDLDGTLAHYDKWVGWNVIGDPIKPMQQRVMNWLEKRYRVQIFTARVGVHIHQQSQCRVTGKWFSNEEMIFVIRTWCEFHLGVPLMVTCVKDVHMIEFWDDRAVQVVPNTGQTLAEAHAAELSALRGAP
jgi:hypothetical protein